MGKPTGFLEYARQLSNDRSPRERVGDWNEFHKQLLNEEQQLQGARCMDCGTPFCHSGILYNGLVMGCPLNNLIPEWNDLLFRGMFKEAVKRLQATNNFPEFTGRVCPAPCEGSCTLGFNRQPVTIKSNECFLIDHAFKEGWIQPEPPAQRTGKKVAVVGSGPAGLACAAQLNKAGHTVTVFERADRIGGLLVYGIPNMKLNKKIVKRRIDLLQAEGIEFVVNTEVGVNFSAEKLLKEFDAAVLCGGATKPRDLSVEGRNLGGVHFAVDFLTANTKCLFGSVNLSGFVSAKGKDVIIIGGGDTGADCVATALRHGCRSVAQFEIVPRPPLARTANNPWPEWPKVQKNDYGQEEAVAVFGADPRIYSINTKKMAGGKDDRVREVRTVAVEWRQAADGRLSFQEIPDTEKCWPAQLVLLAMGFTGPEETLSGQLGLERDERSNIKADYGKFMTNVAGIFTAGDMRRGQSLVAWAIREGRGAARECDRYLMGETYLP